MRWLTAGPAALKVAALCVLVAISYATYVVGLFSLSDISASPASEETGAAATLQPLPPGSTVTASTPQPGAAAAVNVPTATSAATPAPAATLALTPTAAVAAATATVARTPVPSLTASAVPTAITLPRAQPTSTAAPVTASLTVSQGAGAGLRVDLKRADGTAIGGSAVTVFKQVSDVSGNPAFGDRVAGESTASNTGRVQFNLAAGVYALRIDGLAGYAFGRPFDITVSAGSESIVTITLGKLAVGLADADGRPLNHPVTVFTQNPDVNRNPVVGERVTAVDSGRTGVAGFDLTSGVYAVSIDGLAGYPWGNAFNYSVSAGQTNQLVIHLGRIVVGTTNAQDQPESKRVQIVTLQPDVNGRPAAERQVASESTSRTTGLAAFDVTAGIYAVAVEGYQPKIVTVESGKTQSLKLSPATP